MNWCVRAGRAEERGTTGESCEQTAEDWGSAVTAGQAEEEPRPDRPGGQRRKVIKVGEDPRQLLHTERPGGQPVGRTVLPGA